MIDQETVVGFTQKSHESDEKVPRIEDSNSSNAEGCHGREKRNHFDVCCAKKQNNIGA